MAEKEAEEMKEFILVKTSPELEKAIAEQIKTIPKMALEREGGTAKALLGVAACCNSG